MEKYVGSFRPILTARRRGGPVCPPGRDILRFAAMLGEFGIPATNGHKNPLQILLFAAGSVTGWLQSPLPWIAILNFTFGERIQLLQPEIGGGVGGHTPVATGGEGDGTHLGSVRQAAALELLLEETAVEVPEPPQQFAIGIFPCLLYTSDAADE